jgi:Ca2+-binding EF-hand superfamily protein
MNKRIYGALAAAAVSVATLATPAFADDNDAKTKLAKRVDDAFARLDTDKDGKISKAEAAKGPRLSKNFETVDADHDGFVTRAELTTAMERRMHARRQ